MRLASLGSVLALVFLVAAGCFKGVTRATAVTVFFIRGNAVFGPSGGSAFQPVTSKTKIFAGDIVRTTGDAAINMALIPGTFVQLSGNSEIEIEELSLKKDGNDTAGGMLDRRARITLHRGRVSILFSQAASHTSHFTLATSQAKVTPDSDCLFSVWTDGTTTRATCVRGEVDALTEGQAAVKIAAGYLYKWPTPAKAPIAASADGSAQMDILSSLEAEKELLDQAAGWQNRRVF